MSVEMRHVFINTKAISIKMLVLTRVEREGERESQRLEDRGKTTLTLSTTSPNRS